MQPKRFEILDGLPAYGPMYIPVSVKGEPFYSEGLVIRFKKSDGSDWVANFSTGWSNFNFVTEYPNANRIIVIAKGQGYIMSPDQEKPIDTFGIGIDYILKTDDNKIILADNCDVWIVNNEGSIWQSKRISWDGLKDLKLQDNLLTGLSYRPGDDQWIPFSINIDTKEIIGGSYTL